MTNHFNRTDRIAALIQRKLASIIQQELKDPRLSGFVTISAVKVSNDLSHAKIYFTVLDEDHKDTAVSVLNSASSFLRTCLAKAVELRTIPDLQFKYDESIEYGNRLRKLIDEANQNKDDSEEENDQE